MKLTAIGSGYYRVFKDGAEVSKHSSEREAVEAAVNLEATTPSANITYKHDYEVRVEANATPTPAPTPIPIPPTTPTPIPPVPSSKIFADGPIWKSFSTGNVLVNSAALSKELLDFYTNRKVWVSSEGYSIGKFVANSDTPKVPVYVHKITTDTTTGQFIIGAAKSGTRLYERLVKGFRIPENLLPASGTDGHAFIHDTIEGVGLECYRLVKKDGKYYIDWGAVLDDLPNHNGVIPVVTNASGGRERQGARASGLAAWGGVITKEEMASGVIPHAIACSLPYPSNKFVSPATYSDGWAAKESWMPAWMWTPGIPEGTKFRFKAGMNIPSTACPFIRAVAKAIQDYGLYVVDRSADRIGLYCENRKHLGEGQWERDFFGKKGDGTKKHAYDIYDEWVFMFENMEAIQ